MKLLSIQVGKTQTHDYEGEAWTTAYMKKPVQGTIFVSRLNIDGDEQHHKKYHGGEHRAVLMYCAKHYQKWVDETGRELAFGSFAENFTVEGLDEQSVCIGDTYQIGDTVRLQVAQPRQPCQQIYRTLGIEKIVKQVKATNRTGWYLRVLEEGSIEAGMSITLLERLHPDWTIQRAHDVMSNRKDRVGEATELSSIIELEPGWRKKLGKTAQS